MNKNKSLKNFRKKSLMFSKKIKIYKNFLKLGKKSINQSILKNNNYKRRFQNN